VQGLLGGATARHRRSPAAWPGERAAAPRGKLCDRAPSPPPHTHSHLCGACWARGRRTSPSEQEDSGRGKRHAGSGPCVRRGWRGGAPPTAQPLPKPTGWSSPTGGLIPGRRGADLPRMPHPRAAAWVAELASNEPPLHPWPRHVGREGPASCFF
jgi:hypothetical protein